MIRQSLVVAATPHRAWQAWAEPLLVSSWFCDQAAGGCLPGDEITWRFNGFDTPMGLRVLRSWPGRELSFSCLDTVVDQTIELTFGAHGEGCLVEVTHAGLSSDPAFDPSAIAIESGWSNALRYLRLYFSDYPSHPKTTSISIVSGPFDAETTLAWFEPGLKRERWLDVSPAELQPGWRLARHFVWLWPTIGGTLELSVFPGSAGLSSLSLRAVSWLPSPPPSLAARVSACAERLSGLLLS